MKFFVAFLLVLSFSAAALAQKHIARSHASTAGEGAETSKPVKITAIARAYSDSIVLRWAPGSAALWIFGNEAGYQVKRYTVTKGPNKAQLTDSITAIVKPWPLNEWGANFKALSDTNLAIGAELIYGKSGVPAASSFANAYSLQSEQGNRYGFALMLSDIDAHFADGMALRFVDHIKPASGSYYLYTVTAIIGRSSIWADTGRAAIIAAGEPRLDTFQKVTAMPADHAVQLKWRGFGNNARMYSAYIIERSADAMKYYRLSRLPYIQFNNGTNNQKAKNSIPDDIVYTDSVHENYKTYYYRVSGIDAFGEVSAPSPIVMAHAVDLTPPTSPEIVEAVNARGTGSVRIKWRKKIHEPDLKGYVVGRSNNIYGPFTPLVSAFLPITDTVFIDPSPVQHRSNYYTVVAVDTAGNVGKAMAAFCALRDTTPPSRPTGLAGAIDSEGNVWLHWNKGTEEDLDGYIVSYANAADHKFTSLSKTISSDTFFYSHIQLKNLTKKIYYRIAAVDKSKNVSKCSDVLALSRPDMVPLTQPVITTFSVSEHSVVLHWNRSYDNDLAYQAIYRKARPDSVWKLIATASKIETEYSDTSVRSGQDYAYSIESVDSSNLRSGRSFPLNVHVYTFSTAGALAELKATKDTANKMVMLSWQRPMQLVDYYVLYRKQNDKGMQLLQKVDGKNITFQDAYSQRGEYTYYVKAYYKDGKRSALTSVALSL